MNKLLVIGLDGAPYPLIKKWSGEGLLPNLAKLIENGCFGVLNSTMPVHSPTAWSSFLTGMNPGQHGVFDFVRRESDSYRLRVIRANQIPQPSLWRIMSHQQRQVGVINVPMTYPPEPVNGFLITGLGTPDYTTYTYPPELSDELNEQGYRVNKKFFYDPERVDEWLQDMHEVTEIHGRTAVDLMKKKPWDFFMVVFRNTDEICHFFWRHMDETHPSYRPDEPDKYKHAILHLYQLADKWVGEIVEAAGPHTNVVIMSDHGAGPLYKDVFLNEWLWKHDWLKFTDESSGRRHFNAAVRRFGITRQNISDALTRMHLHRIEVLIKRMLGDKILVLPRDERPEFFNAVDWSKTKIYSFGYYGQIFINLKGREPKGIIDSDSAYLALRNEVIKKLYELVDPADGQPVVDKVYTREDLYHGENLSYAPDLLVVMREHTYITRKGYEFADKRGEIFREPYTGETGSHRPEGILIAAGPDIPRNKSIVEKKIEDLAPTLLYLLQCDIPKTMDGQLITDIIDSQLLNEQTPCYTDVPTPLREDIDTIWDEAAEEEIAERLKKLGYLG
ncbi:MAG: hypothetical protein CSA11_02910 [Chloroflexi bacterium]|nr:MAG: hypothetical protein CSA11_02910 [Chloroflexota bacterium]